VVFGNSAFPASTNAAGSVDNIVDPVGTTTVGALTYTNVSPAFHTTRIPSGNTLAVSGAVNIGFGSATTVVNMSDVGNFTAGGTGTTHNVGNGTSQAVTWTLGNGANTLTCATLNLGTSGNQNGSLSTINLGGSANTINADNINMGTGKAKGTIQFAGAGGSLTIRDKTGAGRASMTIGNHTGSGTETATGQLLLRGHTVDILAGTIQIGTGTTVGTAATLDNRLEFDTGTIDVTTLNLAVRTAGNGNGTVVVAGGTLRANTISLVNANGGTDLGTLIITNTGTVVVSNNVGKTTTTGTGDIRLGNGTLNIVSGGTIGSAGAPVNNFTLTNSTLSIAPGAGGGAVNATVSTLALAGAGNTINIVSNATWDSMTVITAYPTTLHLIQFSTLSGTTNVTPFTLGTLPFLNGTQLAGAIVTNTGFIDLQITGGPSLVAVTTNIWVGATNSVLIGNWDTTTTNWIDIASGGPAAFATGNTVRFDDSASNAAVTLTAALAPASTIVSNTLLNYAFSGGGKLTGSGGLVKLGSGALALTESGGDDFSGGVIAGGGLLVLSNTSVSIAGGLTVTNGLLKIAHSGAISGGLNVSQTGGALLDQAGTIAGNLTIAAGTTVQLGNNDALGALPSGTVTDNGALVFNRSDTALAVGSVISGAGSVTNNGSGTVTLNVAQTYTGGTTVNAGTLKLGIGGGTGTLRGTLNINPGATVNLTVKDALGFTSGSCVTAVNIVGGTLNNGFNDNNGFLADFNLTGGAMTSSGGGAFNSSGKSINSKASSTLSTVSAPVRLRAAGVTISAEQGTVPGGVDLLLTGTMDQNGGTFGITKSGAGTVAISSTNTFGGTATISAGTLQIGTASDAGPLTTPLGTASSVADNALLTFASSQSVTFTNAITGTGAVSQNGAGTVTLSASNSYTGATTVSNGVLKVTGSLSSSGSVNVWGGALAGNGIINSPTTNNPAGTLQPGLGGADTSTLAISNALVLLGTNVFTLNRGNAQNSSRIVGITTLAEGGTLTVNNAGSALQSGDTFTLFNAGSSSGIFSATNLPLLSAGQIWFTPDNYSTLMVSALTAGSPTFTRSKGTSLKISIADLLTNVSVLPAAPADAFVLTSVGASTNGATISTNDTYVFFQPANDLPEAFTYTVADTRGGSATGVITVNVTATVGSAQSISISNSMATVQFAGIPDRAYAIQRSTNLVDWTTLVVTNASTNGLFQFTDDFSDLGGPPPSAYYRTAQP
jgi:autotransporter-associated beta strand protein